MTLKQIEYYEAVCRTGSISAAAEQLYLSRTVISRAIRDLEEELGIQLFVRSRNGIELTETGQELRGLFSQFSGIFTTLQSKIGTLHQQMEYRTLTVGLAVSCGSRFYPEFYEEFHRLYPDIHLMIQELSSYDAYKMICDGSIDVILTPIGLHRPRELLNTLSHCDIYPSETVFCVSKNSPLAGRSSISYQELQSLPLAVLNSKLPIDLPLHISLKCSQQDLLHRVVGGGTLSAILPRELAEQWDDVTTISLDPPMPCMVKAIWNETLPQSSALKDLLSFLRQHYQPPAEKTQ